MKTNKKISKTILRSHRGLFVAQIMALLARRGFTWNWGSPARCSDGFTDIVVSRAEQIDGMTEQAVTLFTGPLPSPVAHGLRWSVREVSSDGSQGSIIQVGATNRRGQFRLRGLPPKCYSLHVDAPTCRAAWIELDSPFIFPRQADTGRNRIPGDSHRKSASLHGVTCFLKRTDTGNGQLSLHVTIKCRAWKNGLAYFKLWNRQGQLIERGFVGLGSQDRGSRSRSGQILLQIPPEQEGEPCYLEVGPQNSHVLFFSKKSRDDLIRSLKRTHDRGDQSVLQRKLKNVDVAFRFVLDSLSGSRDLVRRISHEPTKDRGISALLLYLTSGHALGFHRAIFLEWNPQNEELVYRCGVGQIERGDFISVASEADRLDIVAQLAAVDRKDWAQRDAVHLKLSELTFRIPSQEAKRLRCWKDGKAQLISSSEDGVDPWIKELTQRINGKAFLICPVSIRGERQGVVIVDRRWDRPSSLTHDDLVQFESFVKNAERLMAESRPASIDFDSSVAAELSRIRDCIESLVPLTHDSTASANLADVRRSLDRLGQLLGGTTGGRIVSSQLHSDPPPLRAHTPGSTDATSPTADSNVLDAFVDLVRSSVAGEAEPAARA